MKYVALVVAGLLLVASLAAGVPMSAPATVGGAFGPPTPIVTPPGTIDDTCTTNVTAALNAWVAAQGNNVTIQFASSACYLINATAGSMQGDATCISNSNLCVQPLASQLGLFLDGSSNVTLDGQGAELKQTTYPTDLAPFIPVWPILNLTDTTNVLVENLNFVGAASAAGPNYEGDYGLVLSSTLSTIFTRNTVTGMDGDNFTTFADNVTSACGQGNGGPLVQGTTISNNSFDNWGYHGSTVEAADGITVTHNTFNGEFKAESGNDVVDLEADTDTIWCNGQPLTAGEANMTWSNNTIENFLANTFLSLHGPSLRRGTRMAVGTPTPAALAMASSPRTGTSSTTFSTMRHPPSKPSGESAIPVTTSHRA